LAPRRLGQNLLELSLQNPFVRRAEADVDEPHHAAPVDQHHCRILVKAEAPDRRLLGIHQRAIGDSMSS
jgi:hypothetical protein